MIFSPDISEPCFSMLARMSPSNCIYMYDNVIADRGWLKQRCKEVYNEQRKENEGPAPGFMGHFFLNQPVVGRVELPANPGIWETSSNNNVSRTDES